MKANIVAASCYGGAAGGWFGTTHHCLEDLALIRVIPNIKIICPYGERETRLAIDQAINTNSPYYIRLGRNNDYEDFPIQEDHDYYSWYTRGKHDTVCLISSGEVATDFCIKVTQNISGVSHLHLLNSDLNFLNQKLLLFNSISETIIAVEEHRLLGSLASVLATLLPNKKVYGYTVDDKWPIYGGSHYEVLDYLNFSKDSLEAFVKSIKQGG